jgi:hypothetical protein
VLRFEVPIKDVEQRGSIFRRIVPLQPTLQFAYRSTCELARKRCNAQWRFERLRRGDKTYCKRGGGNDDATESHRVCDEPRCSCRSTCAEQLIDGP